MPDKANRPTPSSPAAKQWQADTSVISYLLFLFTYFILVNYVKFVKPIPVPSNTSCSIAIYHRRYRHHRTNVERRFYPAHSVAAAAFILLWNIGPNNNQMSTSGIGHKFRYIINKFVTTKSFPKNIKHPENVHGELTKFPRISKDGK